MCVCVCFNSILLMVRFDPRCSKDLLIPSNLDGGAFLRSLDASGVVPDHIVMNLPASSVTFLPFLVGLFGQSGKSNASKKMPLVHCYSFANSCTDEWEKEAERLVLEKIRPIADLSIHDVRYMTLIFLDHPSIYLHVFINFENKKNHRFQIGMLRPRST